MSKKLTPLGKLLRKTRMDTNETLTFMAKELGVTAAYLSSVERGLKKCSDGLFKKIITLLSSKGINTDDLWEIVALSNGKIAINHLSLEQKIMVAKLAEDKLSEDKLESLKQIINN